MSNYLAIATVTAALQQMLQVEVGLDVPGAQVTTVRPDSSTSSVSGPCINIFLYQATPNPAWRNADLRTRRPKGELVKHGQAGLDLHYLFTFYGNEQVLEPQRLMGSALRVLIDQPLLTQEMIEESITQTHAPILGDSTLADQVQLVRFIPSTLTPEDLSRIWSIFFQVPYALSFPYQATAVLIQGEKSGRVSLPVRQRSTYVALARPVLKKVDHHPPENDKQWSNTITLGSKIILQGQDLAGEGTAQVQIGTARITPQRLDEKTVEVSFPDLPETESDSLRAGGSGIQLIRMQAPTPGAARPLSVESNVLPFVLCPQVKPGSDSISISQLDVDEDNNCYSCLVSVSIDLLVAPKQRTFLLLNGISTEVPNTYIFRADRPRTPTRELRFALRDVQAGEYLLRVQIDGAESPLHVDDQDAYAGPLLVVA